MCQDILRDYDGILFRKVTATLRAEIERIASSAGLDANFDVADSYVEFRFSGRDTNRFVVRMLSEMARAIGDARGEVVCKITTDERDPTFEFFSVERGQLMKQAGQIVRGKREPVQKF